MTPDRRQVLAVGAAAIVLPFAARRAWAGPRFAPPAAPMLYSRRLERALGDGAQIVVVRDFTVRFVPGARGYRVDGDQVDVTVEAPASLARFAQLERERVETSVFPLVLDGSGRIVAGAARQASPQVDDAVAEALARLDAQALDPAAREQLGQLVHDARDGSGDLLARLPPDLFAPPDLPRSETREVRLADGNSGTVTVTFSAVSDPETGLMRHARREVITRFAGSARRTLETWRLDPIT